MLMVLILDAECVLLGYMHENICIFHSFTNSGDMKKFVWRVFIVFWLIINIPSRNYVIGHLCSGFPLFFSSGTITPADNLENHHLMYNCVQIVSMICGG